jgi:Zn-dependent peptidase ImmA (M78 family)
MLGNYQLQKQASDFRVRNGIGTCEPIRLKSWLMKLNVLTVFRPMTPTFCGMALKHGDKKFILVNSNHSLGKQHFTIGHELYHLFEQEKFTNMVCTTGSFNKKEKEEYDADCFASYLLLPEDCLLSLMPKEELGKNKITIATIVKIEQYFACSRIALLFRLDGMGLIDHERYEEYKTNVKNSAIVYGYDKALYEEGNKNLVIGEYGGKAKKLFENEIISEAHYITLMNDIWIDIENEKMSNGQAII